MNNQQRNSLFTLLYGMVLIDNRVVRVEVDQFFRALEDFMKEVEHVNALEAKSTISSWFVQNYKDILVKMRSPEREGFLLEHVEYLKLYEHRQKVYEMMKRVAIADNEFHVLEKQLLKKILEVWDLRG